MGIACRIRTQRSTPGQSLSNCLAVSGTTSDGIHLELTESVLLNDTELAVRTLDELKEMGTHVSLDDFGVGYTSLNYLKRFHLSTLKIDGSFVRDIETIAPPLNYPRQGLMLSVRRDETGPVWIRMAPDSRSVAYLPPP